MENGKVLYPILFTEEQHDWIQALMWFPRSEHLVEDWNGLCTQLMRWISNTQVDFHAKSGRFFVATFMKPETAWRETNHFVMVCDTLFPLFQCAGETGKWNQRLIELTFLRPDQMYQT